MRSLEELRKLEASHQNEQPYRPWRLSERFKFTKGISSISKYNDPTYLGFVLFFDYDTSPLLGHEDVIGTACNYLKRTGQQSRLEFLKTFIAALRDVNINMPWYWQSLEGTGEIWKWKGMKDPYRGGNDAKISITCLESVDLIITMIMDLYRKAIYDFDYRRVVIPENLRKFTVTVHVEEVRMFQFETLTPIAKETLTQLNADRPNDFTSKLLTKDDLYIDGKTPYVTFTLDLCEFMEDESGIIFDTLNMAAPEMAKQKMVFSYENIFETGSFYPEFGKVRGENLDLKDREVGNEDTKGKWENLGNKFLETGAINTANKAEGLANSLAQRILLGNVYGLNQANIATALQQGSVLSLGPAIANTASNISNIINGNQPTALGNAFNNPPQGLRDAEDLGNVFD